MSRRTSRVSLALAFVTLLVALGLPAAAGAAGTIPTTTKITMTGDREPGGGILLIARASSASGTPTGSVTFSGPTFATVTVPVDDEGTATTEVVSPPADLAGTATFVGTGEYADSTDTVVWKLPDSTAWQPSPTVLRIGGPIGLQLTLTFATRVTNKFGTPKVGVPVHFTLLAPAALFAEPGGGLEVCTAVTDATGFATCKGKALLGAVLSILTGGAYANLYAGFFPTGAHTRLPVVAAG